MNLLSTKQAAEKLNVSPIRVRQLIHEGKLKAQLVGRDYVIEDASLKRVETYGKPGRPPKVENGSQENVKERPFKTIFDVVPELAGKYDSGLGDLSINKKYLEGLGRDKTINR